MSRYMAFVDGENLTLRFEAMIKDGRKARLTGDNNVRWPVHHSSGLAWSPATIHSLPGAGGAELLRVHYYTTFAGAADEFEQFRVRVSHLVAASFVGSYSSSVKRSLPVVGRVFHKTKRETKTKSVDINLCVDVLEYTRQNALDGIVLVTGDVDYLPLIHAVMRSGKIVIVAALSSGLSTELKLAADGLIPLDDLYFEN